MYYLLYSLDNSRPEKFRCPQCLIGEFLCSICGKPSETGSKDGAGQLYACQVITRTIFTLHRTLLMNSHCFFYFHINLACWNSQPKRTKIT